MGFEKRFVHNWQEDNAIKAIDSQANNKPNRAFSGGVESRLDKVLETAQKQYQEYLDNGTEQVWKLRNSNLIAQITEAKSLLEQFHSSQIIEQRMNDGQIETDHDDARILAFCRVIETNLN